MCAVYLLVRFCSCDISCIPSSNRVIQRVALPPIRADDPGNSRRSGMYLGSGRIREMVLADATKNTPITLIRSELQAGGTFGAVVGYTSL
jgi:hypothetical protein